MDSKLVSVVLPVHNGEKNFSKFDRKHVLKANT